VSELLNCLRESFVDEEYRHSYAESFMNSFVAAQIKTLREEAPLTQAQLAIKVGTKQAGISRLENVNYSSWKVETLRRLARAFGVRLKITFEEFGTLPDDVEGFQRERLARKSFDKDPVFANDAVTVHEDLKPQNRLIIVFKNINIGNDASPDRSITDTDIIGSSGKIGPMRELLPNTQVQSASGL
jgi:transcriptional regulator with XRE-family HTH domain